MMTKSEFLGWAQSIHGECQSIIESATTKNTDPEILQEFSDHMRAEIYGGQKTPAQAVVLYVWDHLDPAHSERGVRLEWGTVGLFPRIAPHVWLRVPAPELLGEDGAPAYVDQDIIIDPACPGVVPSCLVIHRESPLWVVYNARQSKAAAVAG